VIRGGGGNFGVVTEFEFRLHRVGPMVDFGLFFWELERGSEALRLIRDVVADLPPSLSVVIAAALTVPPRASARSSVSACRRGDTPVMR
jgi:FAD/FMN-containing dehydrogenase